jgi:hypothetical protein
VRGAPSNGRPYRDQRPRYTPTTTFETFPFPNGLTPAYAEIPHAQAIAAAARAPVETRDRWLNPPDLVERVPEVVPGFPDRVLPRNTRAAAVLKTRTLTNPYNTRGKPEGAWLDSLHAALDAAVPPPTGGPPTSRRTPRSPLSSPSTANGPAGSRRAQTWLRQRVFT